MLQSLLHSSTMHRVLQNLSPPQTATLLSASGPGGAAWKLALPADTCTTIPPAEFSYMLRRGLLDTNAAGVHPNHRCNCSVVDSGSTQHLEMCKKGGGGVIATHDEIARACRRMVQSAGGLVSPGEPRGLFQKTDGSYSQGGPDLEFYLDGPLGGRSFADVARTNEAGPKAVTTVHSHKKVGNAARAKVLD